MQSQQKINKCPFPQLQATLMLVNKDQTNPSYYCTFCFEFCQKGENLDAQLHTQQITSITDSSCLKYCDCTEKMHVIEATQEKEQFFIDFLNDFKHTTIAKVVAFNQFANLQQQNEQNLLILPSSKSISALFVTLPILKSIFQMRVILEKRHEFSWNDYSPLEDIMPQAKFLEDLAVCLVTETDEKQKLVLLDLTTLWQDIFDLEFIDRIVDYPDYSYGSEIYNKTLNFYSYLLHVFCIFHVAADCRHFEKFECLDIETYTPLTRLHIRKCNQENQAFRKKYFSDKFNIVDFTCKAIANFSVGASWRWIGSNHRTHTYGMRIAVILATHGLLNAQEMERIIQVMYLKISVFRKLEQIISKEGDAISQYWMDYMADGMILLREYYSEFLLFHLYLKQDELLQDILTKVHINYPDISALKSPTSQGQISELKQMIDFDKSILFNKQYGCRMIEMVYGYVLSSQKIGQKTLISAKIEKNTDNFLHMFATIEDPYLRSLKMVTQNDYLMFFKQHIPLNQNQQHELQQSISQKAEKLVSMVALVRKGHYQYQMNLGIEDIQTIMDETSTLLQFDDYYTTEDLGKAHPIYTQEVLQAKLGKILQSSQTQLIQHSFILKLVKAVELFQSQTFEEAFINKLCCFIVLSSYNNHSAQCIILQDHYWEMFKKLASPFPLIIFQMLLQIFKFDYQILMQNDLVFSNLLKQHQIIYERNVHNFGDNDYVILHKILELVELYIDFGMYQQYQEFPEFDLQTSSELMYFPEMYNKTELRDLLVSFAKVQNNLTSDLDQHKLSHYLQFYGVLVKSMQYRFSGPILEFYQKHFSVADLEQLLKLCSVQNSGVQILAQYHMAQDKNEGMVNIVQCRQIFIDLLTVLHIDFKNYLLNERFNYYHTKPTDMQYDEDLFYGDQYARIFKIFTVEMQFIFAESQFHHQIQVYAYQSVVPSVLQLVNFLLSLKESDMRKIVQYKQDLRNFCQFLYSNINSIQLFFHNVEQSKDFQKCMPFDFSSLNTGQSEQQEQEIVRDRQELKFYLSQIKGIFDGILKTGDSTLVDIANPKISKAIQGGQDSLAKQQFAEVSNLEARVFATSTSTRASAETLPFTRLQQNVQAPVMELVAACYKSFKMRKMGKDAENNVYLKLLQAETGELVMIRKSYCEYLLDQFAKAQWSVSGKVYLYRLIECLLNGLLISTKQMLTTMMQIVKADNPKYKPVLDRLWTELKYTLNYIRHKSSLDVIWHKQYMHAIMLLKLHLLLTCQNNIAWKEFFGSSILPNDTIDRIQRYTTILQKVCDQNEWHTNYQERELCVWENKHRPHLFIVGQQLFKNLTELLTGPYPPNQLKIYTYIYDRYNGILKRFCRDAESDFYKMKLALVEFIISMVEGHEAVVFEYVVSNFELKNLEMVMVGSISQLYHYFTSQNLSYSKSAQPKNKFRSIDDFELCMADLPRLQTLFRTNKKFAQHPLLDIAFKIFQFIRMVNQRHCVKFRNFIQERERALQHYIMHKQIKHGSSLNEAELATNGFLSGICKFVEVVRASGEVETYYFKTIPKAEFLSEETKQAFLKNELCNRKDFAATKTIVLRKAMVLEKQMNIMEQSYYMHTNLYVACLREGMLVKVERGLFCLALLTNLLLIYFTFLSHKQHLMSGSAWGGYVQESVNSQFGGGMATKIVSSLATGHQSKTIFQTLLFGMLGLFTACISIFGIHAWKLLKMPIAVLTAEDAFLQINDQQTLQSIKCNYYERYWFLWRNCLMKHGQILVFLIHLGMSVLGVLIHPFFYTFQLLTLCNLIPPLKIVVSAHVRNMKGFITISMLSIAAFILLHFASTQHLLAYATSDLISREHVSFIQSIIFYVIFTAILIVLAIGITRAVLHEFRKEKQKQSEFIQDSASFCFLCGMPFTKFHNANRKSLLKRHQKDQHNLFNYINFIIWMKNVSLKECNGIEAEVYEKIQNDDISWFPSFGKHNIDNIGNIGDIANLQENKSQKMKQITTKLKTEFAEKMNSVLKTLETKNTNLDYVKEDILHYGEIIKEINEKQETIQNLKDQYEDQTETQNKLNQDNENQQQNKEQTIQKIENKALKGKEDGNEPSLDFEDQVNDQGKEGNEDDEDWASDKDEKGK